MYVHCRLPLHRHVQAGHTWATLASGDGPWRATETCGRCRANDWRVVDVLVDVLVDGLVDGLVLVLVLVLELLLLLVRQAGRRRGGGGEGGTAGHGNWHPTRAERR